jgi:hypothetical protein
MPTRCARIGIFPKVWSRVSPQTSHCERQRLTYADVELPDGRLADKLRAEQYRHFRDDSWLERHLTSAQDTAVM